MAGKRAQDVNSGIGPRKIRGLPRNRRIRVPRDDWQGAKPSSDSFFYKKTPPFALGETAGPEQRRGRTQAGKKLPDKTV